jgi:GWxTD domain-containing protein
MRLKINQHFIVLLLMLPLSAFSYVNDSLSRVYISNKIELDEESSSLQLLEMDYPFFDTDAKQLYFFLELIQTTQHHPASFLYVEIKKRSNMQFKQKPTYTKRIELSSLIGGRMLDSIDIEQAALPSGNYDLIVNYMNDSNHVTSMKKAGFQLLRNNVVQSKEPLIDEYEFNNTSNIIDFEKTFVGKYSLEQLKKNIPALEPIAKGGEIKVIKEITRNVDLKFLKQFFYNFWSSRNNATPEKAWLEYADKLNTISKKYGSNATPGYESDRGKIYLIYGEPDIQERIVNEKGARPYEVWFYYSTNSRSNVKFLFYQSGMMANQMYLLHSTEEDILVNPQWKLLLLEDPNNKDTKLMHRVFEYFK